MVYASSKDAIRRQLVGIAVEMQGTDLSEVSCGKKGDME
jgi:cofilin